MLRRIALTSCLSLASFATVSLVQQTAQAETSAAREYMFANALPSELVDAFNVQIKNELDGAHFYLSVSNHFYGKSLDGFGFWYAQQYYEELNHARIMMDFLKKKGATVVLSSTASPDALASKEPAGIFAQSLKLEETQSLRIQDLQALASSLNARDAATFLQWFIDEQVEEEDNFQGVLDRIEMVESSLEGVLLIDKDLGARAPAALWMPGQPLPAH